jgi:glycosyltransferase involved in cell wall biosynthesis
MTWRRVACRRRSGTEIAHIPLAKVRRGDAAIVNLSSVGRALAEFLPQNNIIPRVRYRVQFARHKRRARRVDEGFSIVIATKNRRKFLSYAVDAVIGNTARPFELIVMDNASDDGTSEMCQMLEMRHPGVVLHTRLKRNIGTNAYALGFLQAHYKYLVCMDDDVLALSSGWDRSTIDAFQRFPRLGFLAMNVVQDKYTNGAKPDTSKYSESRVSDTTIELGPTGAWFAVTTRAIYNQVGGFIFRPYKPYQLHDGKYIRRLSKRGYFSGVLKKSMVYHATGPYWAAAYGYQKMWEVKYRRNYKSLLPLIDHVRIDEVPSVQYAQAMVIKAQQCT